MPSVAEVLSTPDPEVIVKAVAQAADGSTAGVIARARPPLRRQRPERRRPVVDMAALHRIHSVNADDGTVDVDAGVNPTS